MRSAVTTGRPPSVIGSFGNDDTALHIPRRPSRTQEQKARSDAQDAIDARKASRRVAKFTMLLAHGCRGKACRSKDHAEDRDRKGGRADGGEGMHALLDMLGLRDEAPRAKSAARRFER